ncbi:MAG: hypothetical protein GF416_08585 [Candidatus Altiarchaeales archaeon]|nr:hypothetical protein [Candidatus Altiarchaeales archaeon]MBD3417172.1 hypothetical protein [Candidatus Altiarchaeales archaeon]
MDEALDVALELARGLKVIARENSGKFIDGEDNYGVTGDATFEVDVPIEDEVERFFKESDLPCRVMTEDRGIIDYGEDPEFIFLIDPLDGSRNARRNLPFYCCSIAVYDIGASELSDALCAVVERFDADEEFTAVRGKGAKLNGELISPSSKKNLKDAVAEVGAHFASSLPIYSDVMSNLGGLAERQERDVWVKCYGSTALELAYLACGRVDLMCELRAASGFDATPKTYDIAAGLLLCSESGAVIEYGKDKIPEKLPLDPSLNTQFLGAGNRELFKVLANSLR